MKAVCAAHLHGIMLLTLYPFIYWPRLPGRDIKAVPPLCCKALAECSLPDWLHPCAGPYEWVHVIHPDGLNSFDMGVWQEDDGSAFLIRSVNNEYLGISPLSPDYTTTVGLVSTAPRVCSWPAYD